MKSVFSFSLPHLARSFLPPHLLCAQLSLKQKTPLPQGHWRVFSQRQPSHPVRVVREQHHDAAFALSGRETCLGVLASCFLPTRVLPQGLWLSLPADLDTPTCIEIVREQTHLPELLQAGGRPRLTTGVALALSDCHSNYAIRLGTRQVLPLLSAFSPEP